MILGLAMLFLAAGGLTAWLGLSEAQGAVAAPQVFASPIHAGCYIAAPGDCRIHVDPFTVNVDDGSNERLAHFQIKANGQ